MTYCPCTEQLVVKTAGILSSVKLLSLKHSLPCKRFVVFETYTENPTNLALYPLEGPKNITHHLNTLRYVAVVWNIQFLNDFRTQTLVLEICTVELMNVYYISLNFMFKKSISLKYVEKYFACIYSCLCTKCCWKKIIHY